MTNLIHVGRQIIKLAASILYGCVLLVKTWLVKAVVHFISSLVREFITYYISVFITYFFAIFFSEVYDRYILSKNYGGGVGAIKEV